MHSCIVDAESGEHAHLLLCKPVHFQKQIIGKS